MSQSVSVTYSDVIRVCTHHATWRPLAEHEVSCDSLPTSTYKISWSLCRVMFLVTSLYWISDSVLHFWSSAPQTINLQARYNRLEDIDFPAVAICSYNVISKQRLTEKANHILNLIDGNVTFSDLETYLRQLGSLVTGLMDEKMDQLELQRFSTFLDQNHGTNITQLMFELSPPCSSLLVQCSWQGHVMPCEHLFSPLPTQLGFCCAFNSRYSPGGIRLKSKRLRLVGHDRGLSTLIRESSDDFAFMRRPLSGVELLLFSGREFPLLQSGVVRSYPIHRNASAYFALQAGVVREGDSIMKYSDTWRGCRTSGVQRQPYSDCLMRCLRATVEQLCRCVPFYLYPEPGDIICSLGNVPCLNKYREKFLYHYPHGSEFNERPELTEEVQNSLYCSCLPDCAGTRYDAQVLHTRYQFNKKLYRTSLVGNHSLMNSTLLRVFYIREHQRGYVIEGQYSLLEMIAIIVSQCMLLLGVTLVAVLELVFHLTFRWTHHFWRRSRLAGQLETRKRP